MSGKTVLRSAADLIEAGLVPPERRGEIETVAARYAIAITPTVQALIDAIDPDDPIARQFVPDPAELDRRPEERDDPIGDAAHSPVEGIVHRYPDRVLLKLLHVCPVYCRFCFRRESVGPGSAQALSQELIAAALAYIRAHQEIWEVIMTGGDPLALSPRRLQAIFSELATMAHVKIVRVHTRVPVVDPARVSPALIAALRASGKTIYIAVHANHPREFLSAAKDACAALFDAGFALVSQTVLLRGVNDTIEVLGALMRSFVENRIKPYYLHHADLAPGTAHFRTSLAEGQALMRQLRGKFSGLCQPVYVLDIPGGYGKSPVGPDYVSTTDGGSAEAMIDDFRGRRHLYPPLPQVPKE